MEKYKHLFRDTEFDDEMPDMVKIRSSDLQLILSEHNACANYVGIYQSYLKIDKSLRKYMWFSGFWIGLSLANLTKLICNLLGYTSDYISSMYSIGFLIICVIFGVRDIKKYAFKKKELKISENNLKKYENVLNNAEFE